MKIIVNSKVLAECLKNASEQDAYHVTEVNKSIVFQALALNDVATYSCGMPCEIRSSGSPFRLDPVAAYRLRVYCKNIDEQPIVVEFFDDQIDVTGIKTFRF